jgi:hypothetical protein
LSDDSLLEYALVIIREKKLKSAGELHKEDGGLYSIVYQRGLLDKIFPERKKRAKMRKWKKMTDAQILEIVAQLVRKHRISSYKGLSRVDLGAHTILRRRNLIDKFYEIIGKSRPQWNGRSWASKNHSKLIEDARILIQERNICGRDDLKKYDPGLYEALRKRNLLDQVFAEIEKIKLQEQHLAGLKQAADAMEQFSGD